MKRKVCNRAATTPTPDDCHMTTKRKPTPPPEVQDEIERKIRAGIFPMAATLMDVLPDDETRKALWGCCAKPKHHQPTFTDLMMRNHQPWIAANPRLWGATYEAEADALDALFCKNLKAPCNQPPLFRTPLCKFYGITETAQPTTAQAADDDEIARKIDAFGGRLNDIEATTTAAALNTATINNGVAWLVADRQSKIKGNKERGKTNQATGNTEESERAAQDMQTALNRVHDRMKRGAKNVIGECRKVCKEFEPLTTKKNEFGKFESYAPLTGVDGKSIKPDTLAKKYRERFGTKKAKKAKAAQTAKPKRRTK